jgi:drug/metabolite transporter (DMT)-like permease
LTLYLVWGSTYVTIRLLVHFVPALFASSMRNLWAGGLLILWAFLNREWIWPTRRDWLLHGAVGFLMITLGNGFFMVAAQWVPAGYSALFSAISPVILVFLLFMLGEKPSFQVILGAILGIIGLLLLSGLKNRAVAGEESHYLGAIVLLGLGVMGWNIGTILLKKNDLSRFSIAQRSGTQMWIGGLISLIVSGLMGDFGRVSWSTLPAEAYGYFIYLTLAGSILGFWVFSWLNQHTHPTLVSTYTYVNPLVALFLGWLLLNEGIDDGILIAAACIIGAVILISTGQKINRKSS